MPSRAWYYLKDLRVGDRVPTALYMLAYRDGEQPRWTVHELEELGTGGRRLVVVDPDNGADDLFYTGEQVALTVITHPNKTLRSQPYMLGASSGNTLCDLDQQGRREEAAA